MIDIKNNLVTRNDFENALYDILDPLQKYYSKGKARINVNSTGVVYSENIVGMECFARIIWAIAPLSVYKNNNIHIDNIVEGIKNGTNPINKEYWGECTDYDQKFVEMASIAFALCLLPDKIWTRLNDDQKINLETWLNYINNKKVVDNNWLFFRILVNISLKRLNLKYNKEKMEDALKRIETFYLGDGWYSDGNTQQRDYYISFAIHYYSLIYISLEREEDKERCKRFEERAKLFARDFIYWFSEDGSSIPYGRSLIYRFAQSAFWGALAFAGIEVFSWGIIKGILLRNVRWWFKQDIFNKDGTFNLGYSYPNLSMTESYNSPASPYWALKSFLPLALSEQHPFWKAKEEELPKLDIKRLQQHSKMVVTRQNSGKHIASFVMGQYSQYKLAHCEAKYTKFVYSNIFGFNISKGTMGLEQKSIDSILSVSQDGELYKVRYDNDDNFICNDYLYTEWEPWDNVRIKSWIVPGLPWHVRIHKVLTNRKLYMVDGGFPIENKEYLNLNINKKIKETTNSSFIRYDNMTSGVVSISKNGTMSTIVPECNTNLLYTRSEVPIVKYEAEPGESIFITGVLGDYSDNSLKSIIKECPEVKINNDSFNIKFSDAVINIDITNEFKFNKYKSYVNYKKYIKRVVKLLINKLK